MVLGGPGSYFWQGVSPVFRCSSFLEGISTNKWINWPLSSGQVISAAKEDIIRTYYPGYFVQSVDNQIQTKQVKAAHDDSYQGETNINAFIGQAFTGFPTSRDSPLFSLSGYSVAVGEFSGDHVEGESINQTCYQSYH